MPTKKVVIATNNAHKLEEISRMLAPVTGWEFVSLKECGTYPEPVEDADDFEGNARIKALAARDNTGLPALADDSGLVVDALDGAPGVYSSRFAGEDATDAQNNAKLLDLMADVPDDERTAALVLHVVFVDTGRFGNRRPRQLRGQDRLRGAWRQWLWLRPALLRRCL